MVEKGQSYDVLMISMLYRVYACMMAQSLWLLCNPNMDNALLITI